MAEEEGKVIQWPGGADEATDFDFLMVGKNNKPIMKIPKEKLNEVIVINGEGVKAVAGGASSSSPTILRPGPAGQNRKMEDVQGWFVNGTGDNPPVAIGTPWEAKAENLNVNWWDGTAKVWSLASSVALPKGQGLLTLFDAAKVGGYLKDAQVRDADGVTYVSLKDNNTSALSVTADWKSIGSKVTDGFDSDSETSAGSAKNSKILADSLKRLNFYATEEGEVVTGYDSIDTVGSVTANSITSTSYSVTGGSGGATPHSSKILIFNQSVNKIEFNSTVSDQWWICVGKRADGAYISFNFTNGVTNIQSVAFRTNGTYLELNSATASQPIDRSKKITIRYTASAIELYQETTLLFSISKTTYNFSEPAWGLYAEYTGVVSATYAAYSPETNSIPVQEVIVEKATKTSFKKIALLDRRFKEGFCPAAGKKVTLYGDSIVVAYDSQFYENFILEKLSAASVQRKGQSGASWAGDLQNDSNLNALLATNPDFLIMSSVNDQREDTNIGLMSDAPAAPTMIGGLKKIWNALINQNKNIKICICTPTPYGSVTSGGRTWVGSNEPNSSGKYAFEYADAIKQLAQCYSIPVVDLLGNCEFRPQIEGTNQRVFTSDGVHPIQIGYDVKTNIICDVVYKM